MQIKRQGTHQDDPPATLVPETQIRVYGAKKDLADMEMFHENTVSCCAQGANFTATWVAYKDGKSNHDYFVHLTLHDISALLQVLGAACCTKDANTIHAALKENVPALAQVLACATGSKPQPMQDESDES